MPKFGESLNKISLKDLLNEQELGALKNYKQFKTAAEKGYSYEKDELIIKLLDLVIPPAAVRSWLRHAVFSGHP